MLVLVMGVSGAGKTTVGRELAEQLGWLFLEADDFHPPTNIAKMAAGTPLEDEDRWPWLAALRERIDQEVAAGRDVVLACSALKRAYRRILLDGVTDACVVYLRVDAETIDRRLAGRPAHFMNPSLGPSQFADLEPPRRALVVDGAQPVERSITGIVTALRDRAC